MTPESNFVEDPLFKAAVEIYSNRQQIIENYLKAFIALNTEGMTPKEIRDFIINGCCISIIEHPHYPLRCEASISLKPKNIKDIKFSKESPMTPQLIERLKEYAKRDLLLEFGISNPCIDDGATLLAREILDELGVEYK